MASAAPPSRASYESDEIEQMSSVGLKSKKLLDPILTIRSFIIHNFFVEHLM